MNALLITATDTDAGKTVLMTALVSYWRKYCPDRPLGILKPVQSGVGDRELYSRLFSLSPDEVNTIQFEAPLAPPLAAEREGKRVKMEQAWQAFEALRQQREFVLVEGVGGLGSPLTRETIVADLAWDWRLPTVLVVPVKLGAIGQAVANVALARQSRIHLKGIVLNCVQPRTEEELAAWAPADLIESLTGVPVLGKLPYLADPTDLEKLAQAASNLELERLIPIQF
ncbi:ATP-dependent dethiobiotin synthetase BioD [Leptolyngbya sp. FACHB-36]|uniref:dethiobiotin synthase n=1 Tax=Leptolyngbya sp. FACHB-36 TaxID=2692808 RepID=UPI001680B705|nr:ATP-dependent dethiobiotin synthetase BioD [Leptolyngbya sp. FACHB-36]